MAIKIRTAASYLAIAAACAGLIGLAYAAMKKLSAPPNVAIEAYIAPPMLFPEDGVYPGGAARKYKPFPVHAGPDGKLTGAYDPMGC